MRGMPQGRKGSKREVGRYSKMGGKGGGGIPQGRKESKREERGYLKMGGVGGEGGHKGGGSPEAKCRIQEALLPNT